MARLVGFTIRITAPHFVAAVDVEHRTYSDTVVHVAPILHYMRGWTAERVAGYCEGKGWTMHVSSTWDPPVEGEGGAVPLPRGTPVTIIDDEGRAVHTRPRTAAEDSKAGHPPEETPR